MAEAAGSEFDDLLKAVIGEPDNQATRLVFADWLEERDDPRGAKLRRLVAASEMARGLAMPANDTAPDYGALYYGCQRLEALEARLSLLFACLCVRFCPLQDGRRVWDLLRRGESRDAVVLAELYWCGLIDRPRLGAACLAAQPPEDKDRDPTDYAYGWDIHDEELAAQSAEGAAWQTAHATTEILAAQAAEGAAAGATIARFQEALEARVVARRWVVSLLEILESETCKRIEEGGLSAAVDPQLLLALKQLTCLPVSTWREALVEAGGNLQAAIWQLRRSPCCGLSDAEVAAVLASVGTSAASSDGGSG